MRAFLEPSRRAFVGAASDDDAGTKKRPLFTKTPLSTPLGAYAPGRFPKNANKMPREPAFGWSPSRRSALRHGIRTTTRKLDQIDENATLCQSKVKL